MLSLGLNMAAGSVIQSAAPKLLDTGGDAAAAYSLRLLNSSYGGNAVNVRRDNDHVEANIGFAGGELDTKALSDHCGSANGFVDTWFDQSGNGNDAVQDTKGSQPKIYDGSSAAVIVDANGKPQLSCTNDTMRGGPSYASGDVSIFAVANIANNSVILGGDENNGVYIIAQNGVTSDGFGGFSGETVFFDNVEATSKTRGSIYDAMSPSGNHLMSAFATSSPSSDMMIGYNADAGTLGMSGVLQEIILYTSDQSGIRTDIESNINTFYSIY